MSGSKPLSQAVVGDLVEFHDVDWPDTCVDDIEILKVGRPPKTVTVQITHINTKKNVYYAEVISISDEEYL